MSETEKKSNTIGFKSRGSTASWKLRATQPDGTASELFLVDGMTIGRTNANSIQACGDGSGVVERSHARVDFQDDGSVVLKCLHESAGVETSGTTVSSLRLDIGSSFRIGQTQFEVIANPTSEQVSIASAGRGCPYCGHPDLPADRGVATRCAACGKSVVVVPAEQNLGVPTFLPGIYHDAEGKEYPIERFVARGGMGYVLKGTAEQDTAVAIKVLIFDSNTNTQAVSRFKQEIDLLRKLHDPNVLRLISHGQEAGLFFFVMEWVDGHDLRSELPSPGKPETHVDFAKALRWFEQACEGLSAIHRAGAVHRDIKPSNLLLRNDGQLLIADLGVAKRLNDGETGMTCTGQLPGTYWYMAPEQHYAPDLVDQRTDIYSLGLTFWELLTGFRPSGVDPQPPSKSNATVPAWFDTVLLAMLKHHIEERPASMIEVLRVCIELPRSPDRGFFPEATTPREKPSPRNTDAAKNATCAADIAAVRNGSTEAVSGLHLQESDAGPSQTFARRDCDDRTLIGGRNGEQFVARMSTTETPLSDESPIYEMVGQHFALIDGDWLLIGQLHEKRFFMLRRAIARLNDGLTRGLPASEAMAAAGLGWKAFTAIQFSDVVDVSFTDWSKKLVVRYRSGQEIGQAEIRLRSQKILGGAFLRRMVKRVGQIAYRKAELTTREKFGVISSAVHWVTTPALWGLICCGMCWLLLSAPLIGSLFLPTPPLVEETAAVGNHLDRVSTVDDRATWLKRSRAEAEKRRVDLEQGRARSAASPTVALPWKQRNPKAMLAVLVLSLGLARVSMLVAFFSAVFLAVLCVASRVTLFRHRFSEVPQARSGEAISSL